MEFVFVIGFTSLFLIISWIIYKIGSRNILKIVLWSKIISIILLSISISMYFYHFIRTGIWFDSKSFFPGLPIANLVIILSIFIIEVAYKKICKRRAQGRTNFATSYYGSDERIMIVLTIAIVVMPALNIVGIVEFVKMYFG